MPLQKYRADTSKPQAGEYAMNPARAALSNAVNRAIAEGAPVYVNINAFQKWADDYARAFGFTVTLKGNWVELTRNGETIECMSAEGVQAACNRA